MSNQREGTGFRPRARATLISVLGLSLCLATGCAVHQPSTPKAQAGVPAVVDRADHVDIATLPEASTFGDIPGAPIDTDLQRETNGVVARVEQDTAVFDAPQGTPFARLPAEQLHNPTWVPVISRYGHWMQVLLPSRPNNSTGWIRSGEHVELARTPYVVDVDIDARQLVLRENGRQIGSWSVAVGKPAHQTPRGRTYIMASIRETVTKFSPIILPLGTHSETLSSYGGGPGTVALHGWPDPSVFGTASSDGCVRVPADALRVLTTLPLGTLVLLR